MKEKAMAPHSSTLAWKIPWTEESGQSMASLRVGYDWATSLSLFTFMYWRRKWQPTPVFCLENPRDGGAWWAAVYGVTQSQTWLKWLSSSSSSIYEIKTQMLPEEPIPYDNHWKRSLSKFSSDLFSWDRLFVQHNLPEICFTLLPRILNMVNFPASEIT